MKKNKLIMLCVLALFALTAGITNAQAAGKDANAKNAQEPQGKVSAANVFNRLLKKEKQRNAPPPEDGIHDPANAAVNTLQSPAEAMKDFPRDSRGVINWVETLDRGIIAPRTGITGTEKMHSVDFDVIFKNTASMPYVRFPHLPHTKWLTCKNCHPAIFLPQRGGNFVTMAAIIEGEFCGVCHGKVAFPPLECNRCHSVARENVGLR